MLLLDEPTAGMGPEERWRMIEKVQRTVGAPEHHLVFIEHDMDIVFGIASDPRAVLRPRAGRRHARMRSATIRR